MTPYVVLVLATCRSQFGAWTLVAAGLWSFEVLGVPAYICWFHGQNRHAIEEIFIHKIHG